jgi:hypothetical protein
MQWVCFSEGLCTVQAVWIIMTRVAGVVLSFKGVQPSHSGFLLGTYCVPGRLYRSSQMTWGRLLWSQCTLINAFFFHRVLIWPTQRGACIISDLKNSVFVRIIRSLLLDWWGLWVSGSLLNTVMPERRWCITYQGGKSGVGGRRQTCFGRVWYDEVQVIQLYTTCVHLICSLPCSLLERTNRL